jgi:hypothetical protein
MSDDDITDNTSEDELDELAADEPEPDEEDFVGDIDEDIGEDIVDDDLLVTDDEEVVDDEEEAAEEEVPAKPRARGRADEKEEDEDEEVDPDDVEADLDTILKDRLEAYEDEEEDEEEEAAALPAGDRSDVPQKREGEFPCPSCFLLVSVKQVAIAGACPHCGDPVAVPSDLG